MSCFCLTSTETCSQCEAESSYRSLYSQEEEFVPNPLHYHTDVTGKLTLISKSGMRTLVAYEGLEFYMATSLIKKENNRVYVHTNIFEDILSKQNTISEQPEVTLQSVIKEVEELKDRVKELLHKLETLSE